MKTFEEYTEKDPIHEMLVSLNDSEMADNFSVGSQVEKGKDVLYLIASIYLKAKMDLDKFKDRFAEIEAFMKENFNYHRTELETYTKNSSLGIIYTMTIPELESSKYFKPYLPLKTIAKYKL